MTYISIASDSTYGPRDTNNLTKDDFQGPKHLLSLAVRYIVLQAKKLGAWERSRLYFVLVLADTDTNFPL